MMNVPFTMSNEQRKPLSAFVKTTADKEAAFFVVGPPGRAISAGR